MLYIYLHFYFYIILALYVYFMACYLTSHFRYCLFINFNCMRTNNFLWSSQLVFSFWTKNSVQYLWIRRDLVTNVVYNWQCWFLNIVGCCNLQRQKSWGVYSFTRQRAISQKLNNVCNRLAFEYVENCWAGALVA